MTDAKWTDDYGEVLKLAKHLVDIGTFDCCKDLLSYFEKPWNWTDERAQMLALENGDAFICSTCGDIAPVEYEDQEVCEACTDRKHEDELLSRGAES